jgi:hypothetical protein
MRGKLSERSVGMVKCEGKVGGANYLRKYYPLGKVSELPKKRLSVYKGQYVQERLS